MIFLGISVPLIADSFSTLKINDWPTYIENITFSFAIGCFILAVFRYDFLNIAPIANKIILDALTDGYVVINDDYEIIDFNKSFADRVLKNHAIQRKENILKLLMKYQLDSSDTVAIFRDYIKDSIKLRGKTSLDFSEKINDEVSHYKVEAIPIYERDYHIGVIILIKDITESKKHLEQITLLNSQLQELAIKDGLTKAYNRYFFEERLQQEIDRVLKHKKYSQSNFNDHVYGFGLIMFDIDFFKNYNDINGHPAGDELLQTIVNVIKAVLFSTDILCRYGGEEFVIICPEITIDGVSIVAEKIRESVEDYEFKYQESQPGGQITISVGAVYYSTSSTYMNKENLIKKVDENLYISKNNGRNRVTFQ